jgi:hypothetical protein
VRPERDLGDGGHRVRRDDHAGGGDLLGGDQPVHGGQHHARSRREALVEHERLIQVQVAVPVAHGGVQQRNVRRQRRHGDQLLAGERALDHAVLAVQPADVGALHPAHR